MALRIQSIPSLLKYRVSLAVTFSATASYLLYDGTLNLHLLYMALGVFVLAGGASALNEYQERELDARMNRTCQRPIPAGKISPHVALTISIIFIVAGFFILFLLSGTVSALLGLFNIFWYNLFYTNLKRITAFAVVPGSFTGAVPALIGWTAAGGYLFDPRILFVAFFIFIWQVPHFWLMMIKYGKEYEEAGFPSLNKSIRPEKLRMIIYSWIIATSLVSLMFPLFKIITSLPLFLGLLILNIWFVLSFTRFAFKEVSPIDLRRAFISFNAYMLLFLLLLAVSQLAERIF